MRASSLKKTFERLLSHYGPQHWWPADSPFEVMVGAVLTQNTAWSNVARA
ncbi:MAG: endonuclease, partial [Gammaproteobacteria bacterium]